MKIFLKGLNTCTQRLHKLEQYRLFFQANGHQLVETLSSAEIVFVWTCAFRGDVRDNSMQNLDELQSSTAGEIIAGGCMPHISPDLMEGFSGTIIPWRGDSESMNARFRRDGGPSLESFDGCFGASAVCADAGVYRESHPDADIVFHDQFIKLVVSEGCPFACSYCSERLAFPSPRSYPLNNLVDKARDLLANSIKQEIVLIGDCVGEYGIDIKSDLVSLIHELINLGESVRIAINNLHPLSLIRIFERISPLIKEGRISHINLPIQSASNEVLKKMCRGYGASDLDFIFSEFSKIGFHDFDTHIIVGFPGEQDGDFEQTLNFLLLHRPKYVLINRFMESRDMPAAKLAGKISSDEAIRRMRHATDMLQRVGVICNSDEGELMMSRFKKIKARPPIK